MTVSVWRFNTRVNKYIPKNGQNNCILKILYKYIQANTSTIWQHVLHIPPTKILISAVNIRVVIILCMHQWEQGQHFVNQSHFEMIRKINYYTIWWNCLSVCLFVCLFACLFSFSVFHVPLSFSFFIFVLLTNTMTICRLQRFAQMSKLQRQGWIPHNAEDHSVLCHVDHAFVPSEK